MIEVLVSILVLVFTYVAYIFYFKPQAACQRYAKMMRDLGYRVHVVPFGLFQDSLFEAFQKSTKDKKNAYHDFQTGLYQSCDVIVSNVLHLPYLVFTNLNVAKQIFTPEKVVSLPKVDLGLSVVKHLAGRSLLILEGHEWKSKRKVLSKIFNYDFINAQIPFIVKSCNLAFDFVEKKSKVENPNEAKDEFTLKISSIASKIFGETILTCFLGLESTSERVDGKEFYEFIIEQGQLSINVSKDPLILLFGINFYKLGILSRHRTCARNVKIINAISEKYIELIKQSYSRKSVEEKKRGGNIIDHILFMRENQGLDCEDRELIEQIILFFAASTDSTSSFFSMMVFYIFQHPQVQQKLREAIGNHFAMDEDFNSESLKKIEYIDWIQYETLRMFGPSVGLFIRQAKEDIMFGNIPIEKDILVSYVNKAAFFDSERFSHARVFDPQRWNPNSQGNSTGNLPQVLTFGFAGGSRTCIGKYLALVQSKVALIKFMQRYKSVEEIKERVIGNNITAVLQNTDAKLCTN